MGRFTWKKRAEVQINKLLEYSVCWEKSIVYNTNMVENDPENFVIMAFWGSSAMFTGDLCQNMLQLGLFNLLGFPWPLTPKEVQ